MINPKSFLVLALSKLTKVNSLRKVITWINGSVKYTSGIIKYGIRLKLGDLYKVTKS